MFNVLLWANATIRLESHKIHKISGYFDRVLSVQVFHSHTRLAEYLKMNWPIVRLNHVYIKFIGKSAQNMLNIITFIADFIRGLYPLIWVYTVYTIVIIFVFRHCWYNLLYYSNWFPENTWIVSFQYFSDYPSRVLNAASVQHVSTCSNHAGPDVGRRCRQ